MAGIEPVATLDSRFSSPGATATPWATAQRHLESAEIFWLTTVRPDGRPHVTPVMAIWQDGALYFCTGTGERKAMNLAHSARCALTTGCNNIGDGFDLVVEGDAVRVREESTLKRLADAYEAKYGWRFAVRDGAFYGEGGEAHLFEVAPTTAFGFGKGEAFSQTRWRFPAQREMGKQPQSQPTALPETIKERHE